MRIIAVCLVLVLGACGGHALMNGTVVMRISDTRAHVCLTHGDLRVGDRVRLVHHVCVRNEARAGSSSCHPEAVAEGTVTEVLNEHYSVVDFPPGRNIHEGDTIEALRR